MLSSSEAVLQVFLGTTPWSTQPVAAPGAPPGAQGICARSRDCSLFFFPFYFHFCQQRFLIVACSGGVSAASGASAKHKAPGSPRAQRAPPGGNWERSRARAGTAWAGRIDPRSGAAVPAAGRGTRFLQRRSGKVLEFYFNNSCLFKARTSALSHVTSPGWRTRAARSAGGFDVLRR